ncbi:MAG TPA: tetratricopeptide repeat protein, partial [Candidatus Polarisedimenticolia bacterium]|nr:tetratricopeptide repeat protein [Candidatus Polarisedimenticolia bacterium]
AVRTIVRVPDWTDDRALFAAAARTSPASAKAAYNLGMLLLKGGDPAGAIPWLERAVDNARGLARGRADLMRDLATALEATGRRDEALSLLERARRSEPGHSGVLINLGNMLAARGDSALAIDAYDEALALEPDHAGGLTNRARMLLRTGRPGDAERAVADLERVSSAAPGMSEALYHLGEAYAAAGRRQDAAAAFRRFLDRAGPDQESLARAARRRLDQIEEN